MNITLQQDPCNIAVRARCSSGVVAEGKEPTIKYYATIRHCELSYRVCSSRVMTYRNLLTLPAQLYFDPVFKQSCRRHNLPRAALRTVNPAFAEWVMGLPRGWTALAPLQITSPHGIPWPHWPRRYRTLSLFSGIAGLDFGLAPWCEVVAYVEKSADATALLQARMADGSLDLGTIHREVRDVRGGALPPGIDGVTAGFPCSGTSQAGRREGLGHDATALIEHVFRLVDETHCSWFFRERRRHS